MPGTHCLFAINTNHSQPIPASDNVPEIYLQDESKTKGSADRLFLPETEAQLINILQASADSGIPVTFSGARTGITAGAVPSGGWVVGFEKMTGFTGMSFDESKNTFRLKCKPGNSLNDINAALVNPDSVCTDGWCDESIKALEHFKTSKPQIFPPDPTERTASIGGMVACNASGARTFFYGPTRNFITGLRIILAGGFLLELKRGNYFADEEGNFTLNIAGATIRQGKLPKYVMPKIKNTAGYFVKPGMDLIDLFIGAEGTLGAFSEIEIQLIPPPNEIISVIAFFPSEPDAFRFIHKSREIERTNSLPKLLSLEYFDPNSLNLLREQKELVGESSHIPELSTESVAAVSIELASSEENMENDAMELLELLEECNSNPDKAWSAFDEQDLQHLKLFRHALPESINQRIGERATRHPGLTKLGTDIVVPDECLIEMFSHYRNVLDNAGLEYVIFGHIGNNHAHVNILPNDLDEYRVGHNAYIELAEKAVAMGGSVAGEHGIGKLKTDMLLIMYKQQAIDEMRALKKVFDPDLVLNKGNIFDAT
ncbi:MAG: FAD-binding oxidoreductase [Lentisphaerae bacterium]|nr:FAD-binding oxidoreductase [Lentisphaerota bacterium]